MSLQDKALRSSNASIPKTSPSPTFYHCKIAKSGGSRYLAIGKILPKDWVIVRVSVVRLDGKVCVLSIQKME